MTRVPFAVLDIGSNSLKLLVQRAREDGVLAETLVDTLLATRLSEGMTATGRLSTAAQARTLEGLRELLDTARALGVPVPAQTVAVGTACLREAENAEEFVGAVRARLGLDVRVLTGAEEARFSALAATGCDVLCAGPSRAVVADIGGGSLELAALVRDATGGYGVDWCESLPLGAVRLTERFLPKAPATAEDLRALAETIAGALGASPLPGEKGAALVGIGGTLVNLARVAHLAAVPTAAPLDLAQGRTFPLPVNAIRALLGRWAGLTVAERRATPGLDPTRADVILGGTVVVLEVARTLGAETIDVTGRGLRHAVLPLLTPRWDGTRP